jgi:outer membrane immunogenic protein
MKRLVLAGTVLGLLPTPPATAADVGARVPVMRAAPLASNWTGCNISGGVGYGMWNQDHSITTTFVGGPPNAVTTINSTDGGRGWLGRFGGGCDYQLSGTYSNFVVGAFGDYDVMDLTGSMATLLVNGGFPTLANEKESAAWAVGGRIGYLIAPTVLTYVDGGWTETRFDQMNAMTNLGGLTGNAFPQHAYQGWFLGSGFEYAFNWLPIQGLFWRTEYRYASYQKDDLLRSISPRGCQPATLAWVTSCIHRRMFRRSQARSSGVSTGSINGDLGPMPAPRVRSLG